MTPLKRLGEWQLGISDPAGGSGLWPVRGKRAIPARNWTWTPLSSASWRMLELGRPAGGYTGGKMCDGGGRVGPLTAQ